MTAPPAHRARTIRVAGWRRANGRRLRPQDLYTSWSWRALNLWAVRHPGFGTVLVAVAAASVGVPLGAISAALTILVALMVWHTVRVLSFFVAGRPWNDGPMTFMFIGVGTVIADGLLIVSPSEPTHPGLQVIITLALVVGSGIAAAWSLLKGLYTALRARITPAGTIAALTAVAAAAVMWWSWGVFATTVPVSDNLQANGALLIFTEDPQDEATIQISPSLSTLGKPDDRTLTLDIQAPGNWLLLDSGAWAGQLTGQVAPATHPLSVTTGEDLNDVMSGDLVIDDGGALAQTLSLRWLQAPAPVQYQGHGDVRLTLVLDRPYLYDRQGHHSVVYGQAGCATGLPWALTLARGSAQDLSIDGWYVPASCTVADDAIVPGGDFVETSTRNQTIEPNVPGWAARALTDTRSQLQQRLDDLRKPDVVNPDGTITLDLFPKDPLSYPGGPRDPSAVTMPAQVWTGQSESGTARTSMDQALAITGFGAGGALLVSFLLAGARALLGQEMWLVTRYLPPGFATSATRRMKKVQARGDPSSVQG